MSLNSFFSKIFGEANTTDTVTENSTTGRNENLSGRAFKNQFETSSNAVLLDVRTAGEFSGGTIPGALNIDFLSLNFGKKVQQLDKDATYFVFCRSGNRSGQACKIMHKMGFDVRNLSGGIGQYPS